MSAPASTSVRVTGQAGRMEPARADRDTTPAHQIAVDSASGAWRFREAWASCLQQRLNAGLYEPAGYPIPLNVRISCGIPVGGRLLRSTRRAAITYDRGSSVDDTYEIALNPLIDNSFHIAAALGEQFIYIVNGLSRGRDAAFKRIAAAVDLRGPAQRMVPGPAFKQVIEEVLLELGPYPHAALGRGAHTGNPDRDEGCASDPITSGPRAQKGRMVKARCEACGLTLRLARTWIKDRQLSCPDLACRGHEELLSIS